MLHFAFPLGFIALLLPLALGFYLQHQSRQTKKQGSALIHPFADLLGKLSQRSVQTKKIPWWWLVGITFLILALARPQWINTTSDDIRYGRDIILALDVSGSTRAQDFILDGQTVDRLEMIKHLANTLIDQRQGDRIGVIIFGDDAYTLIPMSADFNTVKKLILDLDNNIAGEQTALGDAIALATKRLKNNEQRQRVLVLMTDGANTTGKLHPLVALEAAKQYQVRIHTIGIGSHRRVAYPKAVREQPELVQMPLDEILLQRIANETGGLYFLGSDSDALMQISQDINSIEQSQHDTPLGASMELYWLPLLISMALLFVGGSRLHGASLPGKYS